MPFYSPHSASQSLCQSMWCHRGERRCETKFLPAADGTPCGSTMWCIQGKCVDRGVLGPAMVHGNWSDYGEFGDCSRTCGGGVQYKERRCDNPRPQNGGRYCEGPSRIYRMCNIQVTHKSTRNQCNSNQCMLLKSVCRLIHSWNWSRFSWKLSKAYYSQIWNNSCNINQAWGKYWWFGQQNNSGCKKKKGIIWKGIFLASNYVLCMSSISV